jgi:hypothetical protein
MIKKTNILLGVLFLSFNFSLFANTIIEGRNSTYANKSIELRTFADPFTGKDSLIAKFTVDSSGYFSISIPNRETILIYGYLGVYKGYLHAEPNKKYSIILPDWQDKSAADKLNPYFEPIEFQIALKDDTDTLELNNCILKFDTLFFPIFKKYITSYEPVKKNVVDSLSAYLQSLVPVNAPDFFKQYVKYKTGLLELLLFKYRTKAISQKYFENQPILYSNDAYLDLFNRVYDKYFFFFGQSNQGKQIFTIINEKKSYYMLDSLLATDMVLQNHSMRELVIIKNLHDEFYSTNFSRSGILNILDSLIYRGKNSIHRQYALNVREKIVNLMPGFSAPAFELYDKDHKLVKLSDFKANYVYLNFCSCLSYACMKEFDLLKNLAEKFAQKLIIITIVTDENFADMLPYARAANANWIFLHYGNQPEIIQKYDIRAYPVYYLIGPDGKLLLSPAKSPAEYFELDLFNIMHSRGDI